MNTTQQTSAEQTDASQVVFPVLFAISFSHMMNDTIQSLIPSLYPVVKDSLHLTFTQIGLITLAFQLSASILQPFVGYYTDKKPQPYSLAAGMCFTLAGLILLSFAGTFPLLLVSVVLIGMGSSVFHPEASRLAHMASGGRRGMAQSLFQVGGNAGSAIGPLLAAVIIAKSGQQNVIWFSGIAVLAIVVLYKLGGWYKNNAWRSKPKATKATSSIVFSTSKITVAIGILLVLIFSKYFYMACLSSYYTFYLIDTFHLSVKDAQLCLFLFLFSVAAGTFLGGPLGDRIGRKYVIWLSILGAAPFALLLPHANLVWTCILSMCIGLILASAFSAILVYAQELMPGKVGLISGLFFGFAFGMGGIGSALLGRLADATSIQYVYQVCSFLPLIGLVAVFLPDTRKTVKSI